MQTLKLQQQPPQLPSKLAEQAQSLTDEFMLDKYLDAAKGIARWGRYEYKPGATDLIPWGGLPEVPTDTLEPGDLIIVADNRRMTLGMFIELRAGNQDISYCPVGPYAISDLVARPNKRRSAISWTACGMAKSRIVRVDPLSLTAEVLETYLFMLKRFLPHHDLLAMPEDFEQEEVVVEQTFQDTSSSPADTEEPAAWSL